MRIHLLFLFFIFISCSQESDSYVPPVSSEKDVPCFFVNTPESVYVYDKTSWTKNCTSYYSAENGDFINLGSLKFRGRGNTSSRDPKKSYALKFDNAQQLFGMPVDKRWDLIATYIDVTNLRNAVAFELGRRTASLEWTPQGRFVNLYLNGEYIGNYYLCEHIKRSEDRVNIDRGGVYFGIRLMV